MKLDIMPIATEKQILETEQTAHDIWRNYSKDIFSLDQIEYMLKLFHSKEAVRKQIENGYIHMIIMLDEQTVGYIAYYGKGDCLILPRLYIKPDYRHQGLARQVLARLEAIVSSPENELTYIKKIQRNLSVRNTTAIEIYQHLGFHIKKQVTTDLGNGYFSEDYIMEKPIKPQKEKTVRPQDEKHATPPHTEKHSRPHEDKHHGTKTETLYTFTSEAP